VDAWLVGGPGAGGQAARRPPARSGARPLLVAWLALGAVVVAGVRLPDLAPAPLQPTGPARSCWGVEAAAGPASASSLPRGLRRLRQAGLPVVVRHGARPGQRVLVVPAASRGAARELRAKVARLGFARARVRRQPPAVCPSRPSRAGTPRQQGLE
jgi:hypothetical protein